MGRTAGSGEREREEGPVAMLAASREGRSREPNAEVMGGEGWTA